MTVTHEGLEVRDAARRLGLSERTIWRQIRAGRLPVQRIGRRVLVLVPRPQVLHEMPAAYGTRDQAVSGTEGAPWPFGGASARSSAERQRSRRLAALAVLDRIARDVAPDPGGWTAADYLRELREPGEEVGG